MPVSATYQCCQSVPPISASQCLLSVCFSASQCRLTVPVSATSQCQSVPLSVPYISAAFQCHQCLLLISATYQCPHQCSLSVPITAASLAHISEGEKITSLQNFITKT
ncbi:unnamed protein product, partial [Staurois parvus]